MKVTPIAAIMLVFAVAGPAGAATSGSTGKAKGAAEQIWTIGLYAGTSPLDLQPAPGAGNPVFTAADTGDPELDTVAHPFLAVEGSTLHLFFTAKNLKTGKGGIGLAESADGLAWKYRGLVLRDAFVLSYPCVFTWKGDHYMIPESSENVLRLYRATHFPDRWEIAGEVIKGDKLVSPTIARHGDRWWLFVGVNNTTLRLFHAVTLKGPWTEHPRSPIVENDANIARPAGPLLLIDGKLHRLAQDCAPTYGNRVVAFEITALTPTDYRERPIEKPLVQASAGGWNVGAMHHVAAHRVATDKWIAVVDARGVPVKAPR